jgi:hypothetical protein
MESLISPMLAAALLTIITFNWLFVGTVVGFFCSAALVLSVTIPQPESSERKGRHLRKHHARDPAIESARVIEKMGP